MLYVVVVRNKRSEGHSIVHSVDYSRQNGKHMLAILTFAHLKHYPRKVYCAPPITCALRERHDVP